MAKKKSSKKKEPSCNCIELANKQLEEMGSNTRLSSDQYFNLSTGKQSKVTVRIAVEKADSKKREALKPIMPTYCPICGKKY